MRAVGAFLGPRLVLPLVRGNGVRAALAALVSQHDQPGGLQLGHHAPDPLSLLAVHRAGQRPGHPQNVSGGAGDDLQVHAVPAVLARVKRPVFGDPVDGDEGAVHHGVGAPGSRRAPDRCAQLRRPGRQQRDGLLHIPPGGGGPDREPRRELGERLAFAQVNQDEQGLLLRAQLPPGRAGRRPVAAYDAGHEGRSLQEQRQHGRTAWKPLVVRVDLGRLPHLLGASWFSVQARRMQSDRDEPIASRMNPAQSALAWRIASVNHADTCHQCSTPGRS